MITTNKTRKYFPAKELTSGNRLIALIFVLVNIPSLLATFLFPPSLLISFPGIILFIFYVKIYREKVGIRSAKGVWKATIIYNIALMIGFLLATEFRAFPIAMFQAFAIAMAGIAYNDLVEEEKASLIEAKKIDEEIKEAYTSENKDIA